jgi:hypothetical protein
VGGRERLLAARSRARARSARVGAPDRVPPAPAAQLPSWLPWLEIRNLRLGDARLDVNVLRGRYGGSLEILRKEGDLEVVETR